MKRLICVIAVSLLLLVGCSNQATEPIQQASISVSNEPSEVVDEEVEAAIELINSLTEASTKEEYEKAQNAYDAIKYPTSKGLFEYKKKLDEIKNAIVERENQEAADTFELLVRALPDDPAEAKETFSDVTKIYFSLSNQQRKLIDRELMDKFEYMNTQILQINEQERQTKHQAKLDSTIVVISATGSKYHDSKCRTLTYTGTEMTASQAINAGYEACQVCNPIKPYGQFEWEARNMPSFEK